MSIRNDIADLQRYVERQNEYLQKQIERLESKQHSDLMQVYQAINSETQRAKIEQLEKENAELKEKLTSKN